MPSYLTMNVLFSHCVSTVVFCFNYSYLVRGVGFFFVVFFFVGFLFYFVLSFFLAVIDEGSVAIVRKDFFKNLFGVSVFLLILSFLLPFAAIIKMIFKKKFYGSTHQTFLCCFFFFLNMKEILPKT